VRLNDAQLLRHVWLCDVTCCVWPRCAQYGGEEAVATLSLGDLGTQFSDLNLNFDSRELKLQLMLDEVRSHASQPFSSLPILQYL
jgi:hypothetical protein